MKAKDLIRKLNDFRNDLESYRNLFTSSSTRVVRDRCMEEQLQDKEQRLRWQLSPLGPYIRQLSRARVMGFAPNELHQDVYEAAIGHTNVSIKSECLGSALGDVVDIIWLLKSKPPDEEIVVAGRDQKKPHSGEPLTFAFIKAKPRLVKILKRDYIDIQRSLQSQCWKAAIILCGGSIEAILYGILKHQEAAASESLKCGPGRLEDWTLGDYINVASDLRIISLGVVRFSHSVRDYRNLVHPLKEADGNYRIEREEAKAAFEALKMLIRDVESCTDR